MDRDVIVSSPLGPDVLLLNKMIARDELGRPFQYELFLRSEEPDIKYDDIVGQMVTIKASSQERTTRYFTGYVNNFVQDSEDDDVIGTEERIGYRATLVPWIWFLSRTADCKIFQEKKAPEIIKDVFRDNGFSDFKDSLTGTYRTWEYFVQYRETDFDFVSRLMEQEGIYYYFEHTDGKHTLVLSDSVSSHPESPNASELIYRDKKAPGMEDHVKRWSVSTKVNQGVFAQTDYDFEEPGKNLFSKKIISRSHAHADGEVFDYPGQYTVVGDGDGYSKVQIEHLQATQELAVGMTEHEGVITGYTFNLKEHKRRDQNREYLVTSSQITLVSGAFGESGTERSGQSEQPFMSCQFTALDTARQFRTQPTTPRPFVHGPQTAVVVGPSGDEIHTDKYGRIKVQFHWDRVGKSDENSSCWIRIAQNWAGKKWGFINIPRIGHEVLVEFLEGDPNRPLVTGSVYNADLMPPYGLPDNATQSGIKTHSSKEGTADNFNEIRFEDKKDSEEIYFHAEKDFNRVVENNDTLKIGFDKKDKGDRTVEVFNNETYKVGAGEGDCEDGSQTFVIYKDRFGILKTGNDRLLVLKGDQTIVIGKGDQSMTIGKGDQVISILNGGHTIDVKKNILIKAGDQITLETGESKIVMKKDGTITIKGKEIKFTASSKFNVKATSKIDLKSDGTFSVKALVSRIEGLTTILKGKSKMTIKGGTVNIN